MSEARKYLDIMSDVIEREELVAPFWPKEGEIVVLDQTKLPFERRTFQADTAQDMADAIREMRIRGSGAIGCAGAMGAYLAVRSASHRPEKWAELVQPLRAARPTALILLSAINEVLNQAQDGADPVTAAAAAAVGFFKHQLASEKAIGSYGAKLIPNGATVLTHCHSGALAGAGYGGRALSIIRGAVEAGKQINVIAQETRPYLQGARITTWELDRLNIPVTLATDNMVGALMQMGKVDVCVVGSDRLAINGDLVNKIGTYLIALAAREHNIPFYTATTHYNVDPDCVTGKDIPIELRCSKEVLLYQGNPVTIEGIDAIYPAFDITPAALLSGIVTEVGIFRAPYRKKLIKYLHEQRDRQ